jgi:hypothetical protein
MKSLSPAYAEMFSMRARHRKVASLATLFLFLLIGFTLPAFAQEATIVGTVTDPSGAAVPNATITLTNNDTGVTRTLPSNSDGQYVAPELHIGNYSVKASAAPSRSQLRRTPSPCKQTAAR